MADEKFKDEALDDDDLDKVTGGANPVLIMKGVQVGLEVLQEVTKDPQGKPRVDIPSINKNKYKE